MQKERQREKEREKAIFGGAKPVDTASREREIEERLRKKEEEFERKLQTEKEGSQKDSRCDVVHLYIYHYHCKARGAVCFPWHTKVR